MNAIMLKSLHRLPANTSNRHMHASATGKVFQLPIMRDKDVSPNKWTANMRTMHSSLQLVEETARYVYRILAAKMMLTNPKQFGFRLKSSNLYPIIPYRNITVEESIDDFARFAKGTGH